MDSTTKDAADLVDELFGDSEDNLIDDYEIVERESEVDGLKASDKTEEVDSDKGESDNEDQQPEKTVPASTNKTNLKKSKMERSFEDLLNGLSDDSDPELEDIVPDDIDNTNLESLLGTPDKSYSDIKADTSVFTSKTIDDPFDMDVVTSTPNYRKTAESPQMKVTPPEVKVQTPDDDDDEDFDVSGDRNYDVADANIVDDDDDDDDVHMGTKPTRKSTLSSGDDVDLEVIEDTNHLDVDVSKHKSTLGKKGSLALRRKQSRKSRKSLLSGGEDAIFQDTTDSKPEMMNGDNDDNDDDDLFGNKDDDEGYDLSPPAKKPSPATMMPLPGLASRPPSQRLSPTKPQDDEEEDNKEVKRKSKPPPGAFVLPPMGMSPKKPLRPSSESGDKSPKESKPTSFEKPALKSVKPTDRSRSPARDTTPSFSRAGLRSTDKSDVEMKSSSEERDMTFQKPSLRNTPKPRDQTPEQNMDTNTGVFEKPALRNTPKPRSEQKPIQSDEQKVDDIFATKNLRSVPKPDRYTKDTTSDNSVFDKPQLKSTKLDSDSVKQDSKSADKTFEKPTLRVTNKNLRSESIENTEYEPLYTFEKPALRTAGRTPSLNKEDLSSSGTFEKPSLKRTTPSPEKETKSINEPKGTFDRPQLRKTDSLKEREEKAKVSEKPSWLQKASDKHERALDALQAKENHSSTEKPVPSWLEKSPLRKNKGLPLHDSSNNQSTTSSQSDLSTEDYGKTTPRSRNSSQGTENEPEKKSSISVPKEHNNYTPGWMRQARSPSVPSSGIISPAKSMPALNDSNEVPQWKRELAQRRQNRKDRTTDDIPKKEDNKEPEWKKGIMLRKTRNTAQPSKEKTHSVEPEWKKAAEEKRQRLRKTASDKTDR